MRFIGVMEQHGQQLLEMGPVYLGCRLVLAMHDSKSLGWRDSAGHIKAEFSISSEQCWEKGCDSGG